MSWRQIFLHPLTGINAWSDEYKSSDDGVDVFYLLLIFFGLGLWLVFDRFQKMHDSPLEFPFTPPDAASAQWESMTLPRPSLRAHEENPELRPLVTTGRKYITSFDPATGLHIGTFLADNEQEINAKIRLAEDSQKLWRHTTFRQRRRVIRSLLKWLVDNQELCARVACRDTGKTLIDAAFGEIMTLCSKMDWLLKHGEKALRPDKRASNFMLAYKSAEVRYEPLGVVAGVVSWNYPLHNAWSPILAGIFAGNGVILKCSEQVQWSTEWFVGALRSCLEVCGHDPEIVQVVCCWPEEVETLTKSPLIKHITFIGSETVGRKVALAAMENLTPITLELGGKDAAVILPRTDLNKHIGLLMRGVFQNAGQNCIGIERLIVHNSQYDELRDLIQARVSKLRQGSVLAPSPEGYVSTVDGGAMINTDRFGTLQRLLRDANQEGADYIGGEQYNHVYLEHGTFFAPTIVGPVRSHMEIAQEELFAPIATLMPYDTIEEAIEIANSTRYGLGASVWGPAQTNCLKVAERLEVGMVSINDFGTFYLNQDLPFGGTKRSGYGRFAGPEGLRALTNPKAIIYDRWPDLIQTSIPKVLDYPLRSLKQSWDFTTHLVRFVWGFGWRSRIYSLIALIQIARNTV
ncbi:meiotic sister-chromatid recombination aldehyde dehydrogenase [Flagelloscypha sp. PMI_526]|nr:meiotic sister-chromatid recombination aldehyde dehydrogenase [Flagelloscypha sp. PMI_526]